MKKTKFEMQREEGQQCATERQQGQKGEENRQLTGGREFRDARVGEFERDRQEHKEKNGAQARCVETEDGTRPGSVGTLGRAERGEEEEDDQVQQHKWRNTDDERSVCRGEAAATGPGGAGEGSMWRAKQGSRRGTERE